MTSSKCKTLKSKSAKKKTASTTSRIKWTKQYEENGKWVNDHPTTTYTLQITERYRAYISYTHTPKEFGGPRGHSWTLRDTRYYRNIVLPGVGSGWKSLIECKRRARLAYLLWFSVKLLRNTDDPIKIDREFLGV